MTDPLTRERRAREEMARHARAISEWAVERRAALWDLKKQHGTWQQVADTTGQKLPAITKAAYKRSREEV